MQMHLNVNLYALASICVTLGPMNKVPNKAVVDAWVGMLRAQKSALEQIEKTLKNNGLPSLAWYDVLWELEKDDPNGVRPFELEKRLLMPQYGLSRLLGRIESAGYLERIPCKEDGRGQLLLITRSGKKIRRRMWPVYGNAVNDAVGKHLTRNEAKTLAALMRKLIEHSDIRPI